MTAPKYNVGTPGYYAIGSDVYPVTLIKQSKGGNKVTVQFDNFEGDLEGGHEYFGHQVWKITRNPHGKIWDVFWSPKYQKFCNVGIVGFGQWHAYKDPSF